MRDGLELLSLFFPHDISRHLLKSRAAWLGGAALKQPLIFHPVGQHNIGPQALCEIGSHPLLGTLFKVLSINTSKDREIVMASRRSRNAIA